MHIIGDKQAPVTQKRKATDHIDEELRLAIFKALKLSQIFFSHFVRISELGSKRHRKKSQSQLCWSIYGRFYFGFAGQILILISLTLYFLLARFVIVTSLSI